MQPTHNPPEKLDYVRSLVDLLPRQKRFSRESLLNYIDRVGVSTDERLKKAGFRQSTLETELSSAHVNVTVMGTYENKLYFTKDPILLENMKRDASKLLDNHQTYRAITSTEPTIDDLAKGFDEPDFSKALLYGFAAGMIRHTGTGIQPTGHSNPINYQDASIVEDIRLLNKNTKRGLATLTTVLTGALLLAYLMLDSCSRK